MRKSDYYIMKVSIPDIQESEASEESSSLLDLDNNEFNFTKCVISSSPETNTILKHEKLSTRLVNASSPYMVGYSSP